MTLNTEDFLQARYRLVSLLGKGGMGAVYRAIDLTFNSPVAIKENLSLGTAAQKQFAHEASLLYKLRHPNIPRVIDYFLIPNRGQYLVMDYVEGENLKDVLEMRGALPEAQALTWFRQVLDALAYLHSQDIIHRDVKPANVKITSKEHVYLVDFGLAKVYDPGQQTTAGARGMTPGFAPPEQYSMGVGGRTDARTDIYSAGATLYAMVTGEILPESTEMMTGYARFVSPRTANPHVSPYVEAAILKAIRIRPDDRFQTVVEFQTALFDPHPATVWGPQGAPQDAPVSVPVQVPAPTPSPVIERQSFEPEMIQIPAGTFVMGSDPIKDKESKKQERPQHSIYLPEYYLSKTPVTCEQYAAFIEATDYHVPNGETWIDGQIPWGQEQYPVVNVTWYDAVAYCAWLSEVTDKPYRLPSEAEWEKGARGTDGRLYPWGNHWEPDYCNTKESAPGEESPVDAYPEGASPFGLLDMAGNVFEWTLSLWQKDRPARALSPHAPASWQENLNIYAYPYKAHDGRESLEAGAQVPRVVRGGSFMYYKDFARCAYRDFALPGASFPSHGFRVALAFVTSPFEL